MLPRRPQNKKGGLYYRDKKGSIPMAFLSSSPLIDFDVKVPRKKILTRCAFMNWLTKSVYF